MISLANTLAAIGLFSPIAITLYLDKNAKNNHKKLLNTIISNRTEITFVKYIHTIEKYWSQRISRPKTFILDMSVISIIAISFVISFQFYISSTDFERDSQRFIEQIFEFDLFAILTLAAFIFVDTISFYQTTVFFRFARHCKNLFEVTFIGIADVLMSFFLAIFILPILIATAFNVSRVSIENSFYLGMSVEPAQANLDFYEAIYFAAPSLWDNTETDPKASEENEIFFAEMQRLGWIATQARVSLQNELPKNGISDVPKGLQYSAKTTVWFEYDIDNAKERAKIFSAVFTSLKDIRTTHTIDQEASDWGRQAYLLQIDSKANPSSINILMSYFTLLGDVSFLNSEIDRVFRLDGKTISENSLTWTAELYNHVTSASPNNFILACFENEEMKIIEAYEKSGIIEKIRLCEKGIAYSGQNLRGINSLARYNINDPTIIPVLPIALSSVFVTFFLYYVAFAIFSLGYVKKFGSWLIEDFDKKVVNHPFTISWIILITLATPFIMFARH